MCGILSVFDKHGLERVCALRLSKLLRHRGPDYTGTYEDNDIIICHERLAIMDPDLGREPLWNDDKTIVLGVDGEIYNHIEIRDELTKKGYHFKTGSDCEVFVHLYAEYGEKFLEMLPIDGMFAFVLYDVTERRIFVARDRVGIIPLYYGFGDDGSMWFSSELKAIVHDTPKHFTFPPGHVFDSETGDMKRYCTPRFLLPKEIPTRQVELKQIRDALIESVRTHLTADVPFGVLLSGGLDSSLVASIMTRFMDGSLAGGPEVVFYQGGLHSFSVGLKESPVLAAAKCAAEFLKTLHHSYHVTEDELVDGLDDVIYHLETYDVATIQAAVPMYLMSRKIKATGVKMVLSGEGADEMFGGCLHFHKCSNAAEMHTETCSKVSELHYYDCLRINKSMMAWGVECRVPFLDNVFLDFAMNIDPNMKLCGGKDQRVEKHILRAAFDVKLNGEGPDAKPWLSDDILWRQKEQLSDDLGSGWIDKFKLITEAKVTDKMMGSVKYRFPFNSPKTKEAYFVRLMFENHFPGEYAAKTLCSQD